MGFTVNGVGTMCKGYFAPINWQDKKISTIGDHDAIECFVFCFLPIIPYAPVHTYNWDGSSRYIKIPIRWDINLTVNVFLRSWSFVVIIIGAVVLLNSFGTYPNTLLIALGAVIVLVGIACFIYSTMMDTRAKNIRLILGPRHEGSSDPFTWTNETVNTLKSPMELYGTTSYSTAAEKAFLECDWPKAMMAARLSARVEDALKGEMFTDKILAHPEVDVKLKLIKKTPAHHSVIFNFPKDTTTEG